MAGEGGYTELPSGGRCLSKSRRHLKSPKLRGMVWVVLAAGESWVASGGAGLTARPMRE